MPPTKSQRTLNPVNGSVAADFGVAAVAVFPLLPVEFPVEPVELGEPVEFPVLLGELVVVPVVLLGALVVVPVVVAGVVPVVVVLVVPVVDPVEVPVVEPVVGAPVVVLPVVVLPVVCPIVPGAVELA